MPPVKTTQQNRNSRFQKRNQKNKKKNFAGKHSGSFRHYDDPSDQAQIDSNDFDQLLDAYMGASKPKKQENENTSLDFDFDALLSAHQASSMQLTQATGSVTAQVGIKRKAIEEEGTNNDMPKKQKNEQQVPVEDKDQSGQDTSVSTNNPKIPLHIIDPTLPASKTHPVNSNTINIGQTADADRKNKTPTKAVQDQPAQHHQSGFNFDALLAKDRKQVLQLIDPTQPAKKDHTMNSISHDTSIEKKAVDSKVENSPKSNMTDQQLEQFLPQAHIHQPDPNTIVSTHQESDIQRINPTQPVKADHTIKKTPPHRGVKRKALDSSDAGRKPKKVTTNQPTKPAAALNNKPSIRNAPPLSSSPAKSSKQPNDLAYVAQQVGIDISNTKASGQPIIQPKKPTETAKSKEKSDTICKFFKQGRCKEDDKCKYRHEGPSYVEVCRFYKSNSCHKGANCPFSHNLKLEPCRFYHIDGICKAGDACPFSHEQLNEELLARLHAITGPCKYFHLKGYCQYGDNCGFSHEQLDDHQLEKLEQENKGF